MALTPAFLISAPASGQGKTSVTAGIARSARRRGLRVRVFKTGPDYLDPMVLERASGHTVYQLDLFMGGLDHCQGLLADAARQADLILVEGVMGLFDGKPSSADLAAAFGLPVIVVLDASAMAQTFAALATGMARFRDDIEVVGVVANRIGSDAHARMVGEGLPNDLPLIAALKRDTALSLPERHLGLVQALELPQLDEQLDAWADAWESGSERSESQTDGRCPLFGSQGRNWLAERQDKGGLSSDTNSPEDCLCLAKARGSCPWHGEKGAPVGGLALGDGMEADAATPGTTLELKLELKLKRRRIAVAKDACFSFIYPANLDLLRALGAEVTTFSPLAGDPLPDCDALWLPGGYPELHAEALASHPTFFASLRDHLAANKPMLAECGGMLALLDTLADADGREHPMASLIPGRSATQKRLAALGLQTIAWPEGELRGHTFHYSTMDTPLAPIATATNPNAGRATEALYAAGPLRASYIHHYFPSNPQAIAAFFGGASPLPPQP
ncbi:cobyrinate a,c-diamide synthase [Roseateles sp.]|uniref:cobyrinate a,c-diamide synthase n=1 Tax=Roseateles sp. TaxID=1971397 RepID=UPI0031DFB652